MAYTQSWGTPSPGHIVYLVDLSGSMENKIDYTIDALSSVFNSLVGFCAKGRTVAPRLTCTVIGYNYKAKVIWDNMPILEIAKKCVASRKNGMPIFDKNTEFKPEFQTCMRLAFDEAKKDIEKWIVKQKAANMIIPAPIVINITDGYPYEGDSKNWNQVSQETLASVRALMNIATPDGNVRVFNIHHDPKINKTELLFPSNRPTNAAEQFLFDASSEIDDNTLKGTARLFNAEKGARYMVSNVKDPGLLNKLIEFGSSSVGGEKTADGSYF